MIIREILAAWACGGRDRESASVLCINWDGLKQVSKVVGGRPYICLPTSPQGDWPLRVTTNGPVHTICAASS